MHDATLDLLVQQVRQQTEQVLAQLGADPALVAPLHQALTALEQYVRPAQALQAHARGARLATPEPAADLHPAATSDADLVVQALRDVPIGVCLLTGPEHRYHFTNRRYEEVLGRTGIVGQTVGEVFPELAGQGIDTLLDHVYTTGEPRIVPERVITFDRHGTGVLESASFELHCQPLRAPDGSVIGITNAVVDISDRVALAQEQARVLLLTQAALNAAEAERQRLLAVLHQAPAAICVLEGPDHVYTFTNRLYDQHVGRDDLVGTPVRTALPELAGQGFISILDQVYATGVPFIGTALPIQLHRDGHLDSAVVNFSYAPLRDGATTITGVFVHVVEVTDLVVARQQAEAAVVLRDQFLSIAAHELRTPLTTMIGYIGLVQRRLRRAAILDARTDEILTLLDTQSQRLSRLITTLTDVARIHQGHLSLERTRLDVSAMARQMVDEVRVTAPDRDIMVTLPPDPCLVLGDRLRLEQVVVNLVQNALKYSPDGGEVVVAVGCDAGQVWVQVRDQGLGIPAAALPHLFERFYRVVHRTTAALPGTGLGLAVAHEIVTLHGGSITVESTEGMGSTFTVTLPLVDGATAEHP